MRDLLPTDGVVIEVHLRDIKSSAVCFHISSAEVTRVDTDAPDYSFVAETPVICEETPHDLRELIRFYDDNLITIYRSGAFVNIAQIIAR